MAEIIFISPSFSQIGRSGVDLHPVPIILLGKRNGRLSQIVRILLPVNEMAPAADDGPVRLLPR
ncbi:hypothetical protein D3C87_2063520 [compost metagenome]